MELALRFANAGKGGALAALFDKPFHKSLRPVSRIESGSGTYIGGGGLALPPAWKPIRRRLHGGQSGGHVTMSDDVNWSLSRHIRPYVE